MLMFTLLAFNFSKYIDITVSKVEKFLEGNH